MWAKWSREALARLEKIEPRISEDAVRETPKGRLAWQGDPEARITRNPLGELRLESLTVRAFQGIDLPRTWDVPERESDEAPRPAPCHVRARPRRAVSVG